MDHPPSLSDIIVVGGGGSGLAAALSAAEAGATVLVLEKNPACGGTTALAVGSYTAAGTALQRRAGIVDDVEQHIADVAGFAPAEIEARNDAELRAAFLRQAGRVWDWLEGLGLVFQGPMPEPPNRQPRMHNVVPKAHAYIATFLRHLRKRGVPICCDCRVEELLHEDGRVVGVVASTAQGRRKFRARRGVVLAAGDFPAAQDLIGRFKGAAFTGMRCVNPHATGDGQRLVEAAGGALVNMDVTYGPELRFPPLPDGLLDRLPTRGPLGWLLRRLLPLLPGVLVQAVAKRRVVSWQHPEDALFAAGALLVNARGERFCDETDRAAREPALARQPDAAGWILLDAALQKRFSAWPHFVSTAPRIAYAYVQDYRRLRPDLCHAAPDLAALAAAAGMDPQALQATVDARQAEDAQLQGPWLLLGPAHPYITITEGGARIDEHCRALRADGTPIPGLYAIGQNGNGGQILFGHGLHIAWAITSGRLVGQALAGAAEPVDPPLEHAER